MTLVDAGDISGVEIECRDCRAKVIYQIATAYDRIVTRCPNCNSELFTLARVSGGPVPESEALNHVRGLIRVLKYFSKPGADIQANIRFHVANVIKG